MQARWWWLHVKQGGFLPFEDILKVNLHEVEAWKLRQQSTHVGVAIFDIPHGEHPVIHHHDTKGRDKRIEQIIERDRIVLRVVIVLDAHLVVSPTTIAISKIRVTDMVTAFH